MRGHEIGDTIGMSMVHVSETCHYFAPCKGIRNPTLFCLWIPESWALESGIQSLESGIQTMESGIQPHP